MKGETEAAIADLGGAIRTGWSYLDRLEKNRPSMAATDYIIASEPANADLLDSHLLRGRLLLQRGDHQPALADFAAAAGVKQASAEQSGTFETIRARLLSGDLAAARREADDFVQRFPDNAGARCCVASLCCSPTMIRAAPRTSLAKAAKAGLGYYGFRRLLSHVAPDGRRVVRARRAVPPVYLQRDRLAASWRASAPGRTIARS